MEEYLIAGLLITIGLAIVFFWTTSGSEPEPVVKVDTTEPETDQKLDSAEGNGLPEDIDPSLWPNLKDLEINIYFGSQTGTAEKFSNTLKEECYKEIGKVAKVIDLEDFDIEEFKSADLNILVVATHGEGEPTDNALRVHATMKKAVKNGDKDMIKDVDYTVFGLGDTEYENFWAMGKFFDKHCEDLGGNRVYELGQGDATEDIEADFAKWKSELWPVLTEKYKADSNAPKNGASHKNSSKSIPTESTKSLPKTKQSVTIRQYVKGKDVKIDTIRECKQTSKYGSCLEVIYDLEGTDLTYNTAANLAVFATNWEEDIDKILEGAKGDEDVDDLAFPLPCTIREAFAKYIDLTGPIDKRLIKTLTPYVKDEKEKQELQDLDVIQCKADCLNVLDLLEKFKSIEMNIDQKLQVLPKMMPRYYTIASSALLSPKKVRIAISLTDFETKNGKRFKGLVSSYYENIFQNYFKKGQEEIVSSRIFFKDSLFKLPESPQTPLIMVGPGTGVVPFIAFAEERQFMNQQDSEIKFGHAELYFGCKNRNDDYIYKDKIAKFKADGFISEVYEAFSREQDNKYYIQDIIKNKTKDHIKDLILNQNAYFYICGATQMGKAVEEILKDILGDDNADYLQKMKDESRFAKELWSG